MSDIDEVKARTNIIDVISARVTLKKAGRHWKALCPFHSEKTPSFIVSPERAAWKCFGCGRGGSVIDFVMEYEHVDFVEALESLAEKAGVKLERRHPDTPEAKLKEKIFAANHLASEYYQYLLTKHAIGEKARAYLKTRGVTDKTMKTFTLGYSPNSWDGLLKYLTKKGYDGEILEKAGLVIASTHSRSNASRFYDRFRGRVIFALKDHRGNAVGFSGRLLDPDAKEAKYINTSETPVYSKSNVLYGLDVTRAAIQKEGVAIVMEGEFDVISSFQAGVANAVAIKGSALTEGHVNLLRRLAERLVLALDSDPAGDVAARRGIEVADSAGLDVRIVTMPSGKDPDGAVRENPGLFKKALKAAEPIYDYFIASATKRYGTHEAFGKRKISEELFPVLAKIDNPIVQSHYIKMLASTLGVSEDAVTDGIRKVLRSPGRPKKSIDTTASMSERSREQSLELYILSLILQGNTAELFEEFQEVIAVKDVTTRPVRQILEYLGHYLRDHTGQPDGRQGFLIKDFADRLPKELIPTLDEAFLWDVADFLADEERMSKQWTKTLSELERLILRRQIHGLTQQLSESGELSPEQESAIQRELRDLTTRLRDLEKGA